MLRSQRITTAMMHPMPWYTIIAIVIWVFELNMENKIQAILLVPLKWDALNLSQEFLWGTFAFKKIKNIPIFE